MSKKNMIQFPEALLHGHVFYIVLNANDTFGYACADSVTMEADGIPLLAECFRRWGSDGVTALMAELRNEDPIKPWINEKYLEARAWVATQPLPEIDED